MTKIHCPFHGWQWNLDGEILRVTDREDWDGCANMADQDLHLPEVKTATWGGFVFINMDPDCESFESFIDPIPHYLDCLEFEKMRYAWRKSWVMKANWKIAMESFMESYHVAATHPQALALVDPPNFSTAHGQHGRHAYYLERPFGTPANVTGLPVPEDFREGLAALGDFNDSQLGGVTGPGARDGQMTGRSNDALRRHRTDTPPGLGRMEVAMLTQQYMKEAAEAEGAGWPTVTMEQAMELGADWNLFPNMVLVHSFDATLVFRAVPCSENAGECLFEMASIGRYAPGKEPDFEPEFFDNWHESLDKIPFLLTQDLSNIEGIQRGIKSIGVKGARINPKQETQISHHHQVLHSYLER
jgi:phenylpropionate dioxygenase-like ring-hydroxylating dioxygenase large terminal subunit